MQEIVRALLSFVEEEDEHADGGWSPVLLSACPDGEEDLIMDYMEDMKEIEQLRQAVAKEEKTTFECAETNQKKEDLDVPERALLPAGLGGHGEEPGLHARGPPRKRAHRPPRRQHLLPLPSSTFLFSFSSLY